MKNSILSIITLILFVISACTKNEQIKDNTDQITTESSINASNPLNKYDNIGALHNTMLQKLMNELPKTRNGNDSGRLFDLANEALSISDVTAVEIKEAITIENYNNDFEDVLNKHVDEEKVNRKIHSIFQEIRLKNMNGEYTDYADFKESVELIEKEIMNDKNYSEINKKQLLSATSTLRHSAAYWAEYLKQNPDNGKIETRKMSWWKWVIFGAADAAGGLLGGGAFSAGTAVSASSLAYTVMK